MKYLRYSIGGSAAYGVLENDNTVRQLSDAPFHGGRPTEATQGLEEIEVLAPVEEPRVFGVGLNYRSHAEESGHELPTIPMLFMKPATAVIGPDAPIVYPAQGKEVHFEAELAVVIGKPARRISESRAHDVVLGYTCANDVSERTIQFAEMAMGCLLIGKSFDSFCPLGPVITTDLDPGRLEVMARLNGQERQHANTSDLIFSVARLVSYISEAITMKPGDVILTGTPAGVGAVTPGDIVEIEIPEIGVLRNPVVAERET